MGPRNTARLEQLEEILSPVLANVRGALDGSEGPVGTLLEDDPRPRYPVGALTVDQVPDARPDPAK
jgi:hypothetical protein